MRVRGFVERHADNYELDAARVATELNLSSRYINKLMEAE